MTLFLEALTGQSFGSDVKLDGLSLGIIQRSNPNDEPGVSTVLDAACRALEAVGSELYEVQIPDLEQAAALLSVTLPEAVTGNPSSGVVSLCRLKQLSPGTAMAQG